jgi:hypothetical protein
MTVKNVQVEILSTVLETKNGMKLLIHVLL